SLEKLLAARFPGFRCLVTAADIPGEKCVGLGDDDPVFCDGVAQHVGAPVAMVLAASQRAAKAAAAFVEADGVSYEDLPAIVSFEEAIEKNHQLPYINVCHDPDMDIQQRLLSVTRKDSDEAWLEKPTPRAGTMLVKGETATGAQAHFYMETMCALAIPAEYDRITVYSSTQNPNGDQRAIARSLGIHANQVRVVVEQIGGGFGGKQHRAGVTGSQAAVAARKVRRPVRLLYDRETDMHSVGKRHPYRGQYYLAVRDDGAIDAMRIDLQSDAGSSYDCSFAVMDLSLLNGDSVYFSKTQQHNGTIYKTNKTSNTAFRTFGVIQSCVVMEDAVEHAAHDLSKKLGRAVLPEELRRKNMYRNGALHDFDENPVGQSLRFFQVRRLWDELWETAEFEVRNAAIQEFNQGNRWRKRGISMIPMKYGVSFTEPRGSLNASSALVNVNSSDGSVFVRHGGVEIGQGLHTKIAQLAAQTLGLPLELIHVAGNDSDAIVNAPATAASTGFDLNGGAVEKACLTLRHRLEEFCENLENYRPHEAINYWRTDWAGKWQEIVFQAWFHRINLSAAELYRTPHYEGPSWRRPHGHPALYFAHGVACSEVEVDVLSGEFHILRADILYDAGRSPNPAIDVGQLEGGYVQGVGFATTEEVLYDEEGRLITDNIWTYKPPCTKTIPIDFRVKLAHVDPDLIDLQIREADIAVGGSKTTGEPGMILGLSAFFAIKHAVQDARRDLAGDDSWLRMDLPATSERIQSACAVRASHLKL
ncbi:MAG: molybdopterin cofactor-binding domain-containing protein, partial [Gemmataceae bacterium]